MQVANGLGWWACSSAEVEIKQWIHLMILPIGLDAVQFTVQNFVFDGREKSAKGNPAKLSGYSTDPQTTISSDVPDRQNSVNTTS